MTLCIFGMDTTSFTIIFWIRPINEIPGFLFTKLCNKRDVKHLILFLSECHVHPFSRPLKSTVAGCLSCDRRDVFDNSCRHGHRNRDHCLVFNMEHGNHNTHQLWCIFMGGKLTM